MSDRIRDIFRLNLLTISLGLAAQSPAADLPSGFKALIGDSACFTNSGNTRMAISSDSDNNVIKWDSFSVKSGNSVQFDDRNYLNLVTGSEASSIGGTVLAHGNLVLVNPNGIGLEKGGKISAVGTLTLSTEKLADSDTELFAREGRISLQNPGMGRVTIAGAVYAQELDVNAGQIVIRDIEDIRSTDDEALTNRTEEQIKLISSVNRIDVGGSTSVDLENDYNLTEGVVDHRGQTPISTAEELLEIDEDLDGEYFLTNDIEVTLDSPLGGSLGFSGLLDGAASSISYTLTYSGTDSDFNLGLFTKLYEAEIKDLLLKDCTVRVADWSGTGSIGALAGVIQGSSLTNVEVDDFAVAFDGDFSGFNIGALTGRLAKNGVSAIELTNVLAGFSADNEASLVLSAADNNIGSLAGTAEIDFEQEGTVLGLSSCGLGALGLNSSSQTVAGDYSGLEADSAYFLTGDNEIHLKEFYDPFYVESFAYDYEEGKAYVYSDLVNTEAFVIENLTRVSPDPAEEVSAEGEYAYTLTNSTGRSRNFYFTDGVSASLTGVGLIRITGAKSALEDSEAEVPAAAAAADPGPQSAERELNDAQTAAGQGGIALTPELDPDAARDEIPACLGCDGMPGLALNIAVSEPGGVDFEIPATSLMSALRIGLEGEEQLSAADEEDEDERRRFSAVIEGNPEERPSESRAVL